MRTFATGGARLWQLSREVKIAFSAYVAFTVLGLITAVLYSVEVAGGRGLEGVRDYYSAQPAADDTGGGPAIDLAPGDERPLVVGASYRTLLEASHFHLFTVPVLLLILSHLFILAGLGRVATIGWLLGAWAAALVHLAAPWVIHYGSGRLAPLMPITGAGMLLSIAVLCFVTTLRMWRPPAGA